MKQIVHWNSDNVFEMEDSWPPLFDPNLEDFEFEHPAEIQVSLEEQCLLANLNLPISVKEVVVFKIDQRRAHCGTIGSQRVGSQGKSMGQPGQRKSVRKGAGTNRRNDAFVWECPGEE